MTSPLDDQLEQALAELREQGERIRGFQAELAQHSTTVVSKDRLVTATVGGNGRLTALSFKGNRYRTMSSAELAKLLMETVNSALEQASKTTMEAAQALMPTGLDIDGVSLDGDLNIDEFLNVALKKVDGMQWFDDRTGSA